MKKEREGVTRDQPCVQSRYAALTRVGSAVGPPTAGSIRVEQGGSAPSASGSWARGSRVDPKDKNRTRCRVNPSASASSTPLFGAKDAREASW